MNQQRTVIVLVVALLAAAGATFAVLRVIQTRPVKEVEVASVRVVVATRAIPVGARLTKEDLTAVAWPARNQVPGAFADVDSVVGRGAIATIAQNEPVTNAKVAGPESGAGLSPIVPHGMRAISVRVNDIIGVAGFVVPGTRVDVLVVSRATGEGGAFARTVLSNVQVISAGTRTDAGGEGRGQQAPVVTLAVSPADAERVVLASTEGRISLALRNPTDEEATDTAGVGLSELMRGNTPEPVPAPVTTRPRAVKPVPVAVEAPVPPPARYLVETVKAGKRSEDVID